MTEQLEKPLLVVSGDVPAEAIFDGDGDGKGALEQLLSLRGKGQGVGAPVGRVLDPLYRAQRPEIIDKGDHPVRRDAQGFTDGSL
ncbi:MAG TPA: hypothetical protein VND67_10055 [Acidimicrobiales bacterium]|nr:hypothetical protein [Acidimicrobiales bacterium]